MRMTPAQMALALICGETLPPMVPTPEDMCDRLREGRAGLVKVTGKDFGYDLQAWHDYLKESRDGGYRAAQAHHERQQQGNYRKTVLITRPTRAQERQLTISAQQ